MHRYGYILPTSLAAAQAALASLRHDGWLNETSSRSYAKQTLKAAHARGSSARTNGTRTQCSAHGVLRQGKGKPVRE